MSTTDTADKYAAQACYDENNRPIARAGFMAGWNAANLDATRLRDGIKAALAQPTIAEHIEFVGRHPGCTCKTCQLAGSLRALLDGEAKG